MSAKRAPTTWLFALNFLAPVAIAAVQIWRYLYLHHMAEEVARIEPLCSEKATCISNYVPVGFGLAVTFYLMPGLLMYLAGIVITLALSRRYHILGLVVVWPLVPMLLMFGFPDVALKPWEHGSKRDPSYYGWSIGPPRVAPAPQRVPEPAARGSAATPAGTET